MRYSYTPPGDTRRSISLGSDFEMAIQKWRKIINEIENKSSPTLSSLLARLVDNHLVLHGERPSPEVYRSSKLLIDFFEVKRDASVSEITSTLLTEYAAWRGETARIRAAGELGLLQLLLTFLAPAHTHHHDRLRPEIQSITQALRPIPIRNTVIDRLLPHASGNLELILKQARGLDQHTVSEICAAFDMNEINISLAAAKLAAIDDAVGRKRKDLIKPIRTFAIGDLRRPQGTQ